MIASIKPLAVLTVGLSLVSSVAAAEGSHGVELLPFVPPNLEHLEEAVADQLRETEEILASMGVDSQVSPTSLADAYGQAGRLYHAYELVDPAAVCYANAARLSPRDFRWTYLLAVLDHQEGRVEKGIEGYQHALELQPTSVPAWVRLGEAFLAAQQLGGARDALTRALEVAPGNAAALAGLGQVELSEKRYDVAVERLQAALKASPESNRLHHPLGLAYRGVGDMDKARHHLGLRGKVGVKPADPLIDELPELKLGERVFLLRGHMAFRAGRYPEAVEAFRAALAARPDSVRAKVNLGSALAQTGDRDGAIASYREALEQEPENRTAQFNLGVLLVQTGDAEGAAEALKGAVELAPDDVEAHLELARILRRIGRGEEALLHASRGVELDPAREDGRLLEAQILVQLRRFGDARESLEAAHSTMPEAGRTMVALAKLLAASPDLSQRDGPRAVELALAVYQASGDVHHAETLAMALAESGRCEEAAALQSKALAAAKKGGAEALAASFAETLAQFERRPCRMP